MRLPDAGRPDRAGLLVGAALGVGLGLMANLARKALVQAPSYFAGEWDEALATEHEGALRLLDAIEGTGVDDAARRTLLLTQLKHALGKHAFAEEHSVYPTLREHGLLEAEEELNREHAETKFLLHRLTVLERDDPQWLPTVRELRTGLQSHMTDEETRIFPRLRAALSEAENAALTGMLNREGLKLA